MAAPDTTTDGPAAVPTKISKWDRPRQPRDWRYWVGGLGRVLIATGLLMFAFVAYQLWGTGIETARAQNALEDDFNALLASTVPVSTVPPTTVPVDPAPDVTVAPPTSDAPATTAPVPAEAQNLPAFQEGDVIARLEIPSIGVDNYVVAGVEKSDLKKGPGHYPETPLPGQLGNAAIAGHRTTYGQPFYDIDQVDARRRDHRHHAGGTVRLHRHGSTDRRPERLPGGRHDRSDGRHADPHLVPPAIHRTGPHRDHERTRSDAVGPGRRERPQLRTSARTGRRITGDPARRPDCFGADRHRQPPPPPSAPPNR